MSRLFNRKNKSGRRWISEEEYQAGEKFRVEFERSNLQPHISANWKASISTKTRTNVASDLSDFSIDCRKRLNAAIKTLGPELSDIVLDVCCYLKGLEEIEREKAWPPRSAKLLLKAALASLARHYGLDQQNTRRKVSSWNGKNYRPGL